MIKVVIKIKEDKKKAVNGGHNLKCKINDYQLMSSIAERGFLEIIRDKLNLDEENQAYIGNNKVSMEEYLKHINK